MRSSGQSRFLSERRARLARTLSGWARKRQGEDALPLTLQARRIYILPTPAGVAAGLLLFLMLLAGMNYANSLALLLCFISCGVALVSMHECHASIAGIVVLRAEAEHAFAGRRGALQVWLENPQPRQRAGLQLRVPGCEPTRFGLSPAASLSLRVGFQARVRGRLRIEQLELACDAPFGLFRAWTWIHLPLETIVYPAPAGTRTLPQQHGDARHAERQLRVAGEEEWAGLRPLQESDPPRRVAWKAYARGAPLLVAHYDAPAGRHRWLELQRLPSLPREAQLSQLTQWVLDCERLGEVYGLRLPQQTVPPGHGVAHQRACLEALALCPA